jgi:Tfp pilus assembly protein PilX
MKKQRDPEVLPRPGPKIGFRGPTVPAPFTDGSEKGAVLITGLLILVVMTILGLGSMRGTILQERMAGNLKEQASAFHASEAALQAALTLIEQSLSPPGLDAWGGGSLVEACKVTDPDGADACSYMAEVLADWRSSTTPVQGVPLASLGGSALLDVQDARQPRVTVEERYVAPLEFESAAQGRGIYFYTVTALGTGQGGQSKTILQTTVPKVFDW